MTSFSYSGKTGRLTKRLQADAYVIINSRGLRLLSASRTDGRPLTSAAEALLRSAQI
jgi:hypothetical protein